MNSATPGVEIQSCGPCTDPLGRRELPNNISHIRDQAEGSAQLNASCIMPDPNSMPRTVSGRHSWVQGARYPLVLKIAKMGTLTIMRYLQGSPASRFCHLVP